MISTNPSVWIGVILIICTYTFLWKDQDLYRFAEYTFLGSATGYTFIQSMKNILDIGITPIQKGDLLALIPMALGFVLYFNFHTRYRWVYRWPFAVLVGLGTGIALRGSIKADFLDQVIGTLLPLVTRTPIDSFNNIIIVVTVVFILFYFVYTLEFTGTLGGTLTSWIQRWARTLMMVGFGAAFGNVLMYRVTIFLGRIQYILYEALGL